MNRNVISTILVTKLGVFLLIFLAYSFFPFNTLTYLGNFTYPYHAPISLATSYQTWDAQHYLFLSEKGYRPYIPSDAFPFVFPLLIHIGTFLTRNSFWSGILLSNIFSCIGLYLFYVLVKQETTEKIAFASLLAVLAFPTSFYFSLIYTESLFFLLVMLFFWFLYKRYIILAGIAAFFMPLTRLIGVAIVIPFLSSYVLQYHHHKLTDEVKIIAQSLFRWQTLLLLLPIAGLGVSMVVMYLTTGNFFSQFNALKGFVSGHSVTSFFNPFMVVGEFFHFPLSIHGFTNSLIDRIFFLLFLLSLRLIYKRVSLTLFIYAIVFGIFPVLSGSFMSYTRYLLVVFPVFIALGKISQETTYKNYAFIALYFSLLLQALFIIMQSLNYWVA